MATITDFRNFVLCRTGNLEPGQFCLISDARANFWENFHNFSWQRYKQGLKACGNTIPTGTRDIDACVELTDDEWKEYVRQFQALPKAARQ